GWASTMAIWELAPGSPWNAIFSFLVMPGLLAAAQALAIAFSSEVEAGSRRETRQTKLKASFNENEALICGGRFRGHPACRPRAAPNSRWRRRSACRLPARGAARVSRAVPGPKAAASRNVPAQPGDRHRARCGGSADRRHRARWRG